MPVFGQIEWSRFDFRAIVHSSGVTSIDGHGRDKCIEWLGSHGYVVSSLDCSAGFRPFLRDYSDLMQWETKFGYSLTPADCNLDAVRDGFDFDASKGSGHVLELVRPDIIWRKNRKWVSTFLEIASSHSRLHLALGQRFFTVLVFPETRYMTGQTYESLLVPPPFVFD